MRAWGFTDAEVTPSGPDGGIDVDAVKAVAQVKFKPSQVGLPEVQQLFGARGGATHKQLLFFAGTSYSSKAVAYADTNHVALFEYDLVGGVQAVNQVSRRLLRGVSERHEQHFQREADRFRLEREANEARRREEERLRREREVVQRVSPPKLTQPLASTEQASGHVNSASTTTASAPAEVGPVFSGVVAAVILFLPATLTLVGFSAALSEPNHMTLSVLIGVVGAATWLFALTGVGIATRGPRARWRWPLGLVAVAIPTAPAIALWSALATHFAGKSDGGSFVVLSLMVAPLVIMGITK